MTYGYMGYGNPQQTVQWGPPNPFSTAFQASILPGASRFGNLTVVDKVPFEMLDLIDPHWYQFPPLNPLWHSLLGYAMVLFTIVSMLGNGVVVSVFMSTKTLRTPANLLVVNLAFSDFCMMLTMGPPMIINCYYETWIFGPLMCEIYGMLGSLWGYASIGSMVMIALDRHSVIVKGFTAKPLTTKRAIVKILFTWFIAIFWTVIPLMGWNRQRIRHTHLSTQIQRHRNPPHPIILRYVPEGNMTACGLDYLKKDWFSRSYILFYASFCYAIPLLTIIWAYYFIVKAVFNHEKQMREQAKKMNVASLRSAESQKQSTETKLAKIALMTISLWFLAWTPYLIINFMGIFDGGKISPLTTIWGSVFAKMGSIYNPIVYGISHPKYRAALMKKYPCLACAAEPPEAEILSQASHVTTAVMDEKP